MSSKSQSLRTSSGIPSVPAAFPLVRLAFAAVYSSFVKGPVFMFEVSMTVGISSFGSPSTDGSLPSRLPKYCCHFNNLSSLLFPFTIPL